MPQAIIYLESDEDKKVVEFSKQWNISKAETIKRIIMEFEEKGEVINRIS